MAQHSLHTDEARWTGLNEVLRMALPIIVGSLSFTVMQFVDQVMVARLGELYLAAAGAAGIAVFTTFTFFLGLIGSVSTFVSQSYGRGRTEDCARYAWQGVYIALATFAIIVLLWPLAALAEPFLRWVGHTAEARRLEIGYFRIRALGLVFMVWQAALTAFFQAVKRPLVPMLVGVVSNLANILLNYALIFGKFGLPRLELDGAALATVISIGIQTALLQIVFLGPRIQREYASRRTWAFDRDKLNQLLRIGVPNGVTFFMDVCNWAVFTVVLVGRFGVTALAAHTAAISVMHLSFMPAIGLNHAIAPIVGHWIGRGNIRVAKARTYTTLKLAMAYMITMGVLMVVFGRDVIWLCFSKNPEVLSLGYVLLLLAALFQAFDAINIVTTGALRGAGDTLWMAIATIALGYFFFLPVAGTLAWALKLGAVGAWLGATLYIIALSGLLFARFHGERWRNINIFAGERPAR